jgi:threonine/homoserine/homoserine lactone efflux protein
VILESLASLGAGVVIGWSLAAPPGPVNAVIASNAVQRSWRAGFLVGAGAMTADAIFLTLSIVAHQALLGVRSVLPVIAFLGAGVLAYFAWTATRAWSRMPAAPSEDSRSHASSYAKGLGINLTSPFPILWWLTVGIVLIDQLGPLVLVGFFAGLLTWISAFPYVLRMAQQRFAKTYRAVLAFSIACLLAFAAWLVWSGITSFA